MKLTNENNDGDALTAIPSLVLFMNFVLIIAHRVFIYRNERNCNAIISIKPALRLEQYSRYAIVLYNGVHGNEWTPIMGRQSCYRAAPAPVLA
jgi:hypothetical protein